MRASLREVGARFLARPDPRAVRYLNFAVSFRCNSRCVTCDIWRIERHDDLTPDEVRRILEGSRAMQGLTHLALTGGEPFLREDLPDLALLFYGRHPSLRLTIPTNSLTPDRVGEGLGRILRDGPPGAPPILLAVSLDGLNGTHDRIRGIGGNFQKVLRVLDLAERLTPRVERALSFTIVKENVQDLWPAYLLARDRGIGFSFQFAAVSETYYAKPDVSALRPGPEELAVAREAIGRIIRDREERARPLRRVFATEGYFARRLVDYHEDPRRLASCWSGTHSAFLNPRGDLYPCITLSTPLGNVREHSFDEVWFSPRAERIRRSIAARACHCWTPCEALPSLLRNPVVPLENAGRLLGGRWRRAVS